MLYLKRNWDETPCLIVHKVFDFMLITLLFYIM